MEIICGIYKITSPNHKVYIGQSKNIYQRWTVYRRLECKQQKLLYNSLKKYGVKNHKFEIVCQCEEKDLNDLEYDYIYLFDSLNIKHGLNLLYSEYQKIQKKQKTIIKKGLKRLKLENIKKQKENRKIRDKLNKQEYRRRLQEYIMSEEWKRILPTIPNPLDYDFESREFDYSKIPFPLKDLLLF